MVSFGENFYELNYYYITWINYSHNKYNFKLAVSTFFFLRIFFHLKSYRNSLYSKGGKLVGGVWSTTSSSSSEGRTDLIEVRNKSAHDTIQIWISGPPFQGSFHWTALLPEKQVLFWAILDYHRFVLLPFFTVFYISFLMFSHLFPKSHLLCNRCTCVPVYKYSTLSVTWRNEGGKGDYDSPTLKLEMLGVCPVTQGPRMQRKTQQECRIWSCIIGIYPTCFPHHLQSFQS